MLVFFTYIFSPFIVIFIFLHEEWASTSISYNKHSIWPYISNISNISNISESNILKGSNGIYQNRKCICMLLVI